MSRDSRNIQRNSRNRNISIRSKGRGVDTPTETREKAGPPGNLLPIILLSILRMILAICMFRRCLEKLLQKVPPTQATYQQGRSTAELVFTFKVLAEKAITSENYKIMLVLLDMSKAFDTVR